VPTPADPRLTHSVVGRGAAGYLDRFIQSHKPRQSASAGAIR
jgi:hypothetical protein